MEFLGMARDAFQAHINSTTPPPFVNKVTVGAAILRMSHNPQILLLRRNPDEPYYPNVFEMPGGKVDANDASIRDAIVREVFEETQFRVTSNLWPLCPMTYTTEKKVTDGLGQDTIVRRYAMQLSYIVVVDEDGRDVVVNKQEHSTSIWADSGGLDGILLTKEMRTLILEALGYMSSSMFKQGHTSTSSTSKKCL